MFFNNVLNDCYINLDIIQIIAKKTKCMDII